MRNIKLTKEQYEKLKPFEKELINAYRNSFLHMSGSEFIEIAELYKKITGTALTRSQMGCNTCRLNALRTLGESYVAYQNKDKEKKSKAGRPKKLKDEDGSGE